MKRLIRVILIALATVMVFGTAMVSYADTQSPAPTAQVVMGEVLKIEGDFFTLKDTAGKEVRFRVTKDTELFGSFKAGDIVEARLTSEGHAKSVMIVKSGG